MSDAELRKEICSVMNIFEEELPEYLPNTFGTTHMEKLLKLIDLYTQRKEVEAKKRGAIEFLDLLDSIPSYIPLTHTPKLYAHGKLDEYVASITKDTTKETEGE